MSANRLLGLRCKGTIKFADVQIFEVKSENGVVTRKYHLGSINHNHKKSAL